MTQIDVHKELTVGQVAARSGVAVTALHFYESKGLIKKHAQPGQSTSLLTGSLAPRGADQGCPAPGHSLGGNRRGVEKNLPDNRAPTAADWQTLSAQWSRDLDERINQLMTLRDRLNGCIGCGCLSMEACPLRNQGDVLGQQGPGAHLLE
nr:redox-sensitive transcriptional activator SoxR [Pseudomonas brassicacearum subsp. brassicacearum]